MKKIVRSRQAVCVLDDDGHQLDENSSKPFSDLSKKRKREASGVVQQLDEKYNYYV